MRKKNNLKDQRSSSSKHGGGERRDWGRFFPNGGWRPWNGEEIWKRNMVGLYEQLRKFNRLSCPIKLNPKEATFDDVAMHALLRQRLSPSTVEKNLRYANEKGVRIILYLNDLGAKKFGLERILKQFADWGAAGVKYGFMQGHNQEKVIYTRKVIEMCAKYKLLVDFHDEPVPPSGDNRTFPNIITREYCHSQADAKSSYWPETAVSAPFINGLTGSLDLCSGWYDLDGAESRERVFVPIPGTVAAENAKLVVNYSGLNVLPDAPEEYLKKPDLFEFIRVLPNTFDDVKIFNDVIGESITVARRSGKQWFVGSLTNRDGRTLNIPLDFLQPGVKYDITIYEDSKDTHFINNKEAYLVKKITGDSKTVLKAELAPGGGQSIWIRPVK